MSVKRKRIVLSLEKKVLIINRAVDHGESIQKLADEFGVGQQTVRDLIKQKNEIFKFISCPELSATRKTMKKSSLSDMESALFEWFKQKRIEGLPISGPIVCEKAKWFHENLKIEESFNASQGWLFRFKTRHGIRQLDIQGECLSGDLTAATLFNDEFNSMLSKLNLSPDQVYNADESGLFWKMLPSKTLAAQSEKSAPGHKSSKERLTIMTCSNATGTHKIKLTVIGKAKKPRSFKGTEMKYFPCDYYHHPKAWMNQVIFSEWYFNVFVPSVKKFQDEKGIPKRAVLLLDNAPSHPSESTLKTMDGQIFVYYLPPNVTSLIQPMDQGVISCLKRKYKKIFLLYLLQENCYDSMKELLKTWTIKDAIFAVCNAWENVPASTLRLSWVKILDQGYGDEENVEDTDIEDCLELATSIPDFTNVDKDDIVDWLQKDHNEEGFERLSDFDIAARYGSTSTLSTSQKLDSSSESDNESESFEKIQTSQAMEAVDVLLKFCEQEDFDFHDVIGLRKIRSEVRTIISKQKKQRLITSYFS
ncbi:jerky protein homolog-like [Daktulosphaira vitifoliae]|uniref:jerky protein homolog-like n=1 Tax=Daktulosphaira vitifoliae TaxID=58002 RepID=UPI0021AABDFD|nr:jerky protein homolog-like [Daktulosphaira vitifoliae]